MAVFTLALALSLAAQDFTEVQKDTRCVVALQAMASSMPDAGNKSAVGGIMLFYMGRMSAQMAPNKIEGAINAAGATMDKTKHGEVAMACIERMKGLAGLT